MSGTEDVSSTDVDRGTREISVTGQRAVESRQVVLALTSPAHCPYRSFITSTIISSAVLPVRRAGHRSRGSLVVTVVVAVAAFLLAVLSMYVSVASSVDPILSQRDGM